MSTRRDYSPVLPDAAMEDDCRQLIRLAVREDLDRAIDWTTVALVDETVRGSCEVVPRQTGICAGLITVPWIIDEMDADLAADLLIKDGDALVVGKPMVRLSGNARDLLTCERLILNMVSRLCGIASLTARFCERLQGHTARLYDTRKTTPGYRRLEKYAVRCGGGHNHRTGLFDGFLVKDNHLALAGEHDANGLRPLAAHLAAEKVRRWRSAHADSMLAPEMIEIEVDSLDQLRDVLPAGPDIVLLDNFKIPQLLQAVELRNRLAPQVELEASGNVKLDTIAEIAKTGVERISSGALTHQATWLDLGMDWANDL